jgi:hypothetical protein
MTAGGESETRRDGGEESEGKGEEGRRKSQGVSGLGARSRGRVWDPGKKDLQYSGKRKYQYYASG